MSQKKITMHRVDISDGRGFIKDSRGYECAELIVHAESDTQYVVRDPRYNNFVIIEKAPRYKRDTFSTIIARPSISFSTNDNVWGNRISYLLYTTKSKRKATIKREIEEEASRKFGFFFSGLNLSCLDD